MMTNSKLIPSCSVLALLVLIHIIEAITSFAPTISFITSTSTKINRNIHRLVEIRTQTTGIYHRGTYRYSLQAAKGDRNIHRYDKSTRTRTRTQRKRAKEKTVVILYYKPKGVITSHSNNDAVSNDSSESKRRTVYEDIMSMNGYLPLSSQNAATSAATSAGSVHVDVDVNTITNPNPESFSKITGIQSSKLHAIGRLDAETTGLLLLTNDGQLVHHVTNPTASSSKQKKVVKVYEALIMGHHTLDINMDTDTDTDTDTDSSTTTNTREEAESSQKLRRLLNGVDIGKKYGGMTQPPEALEVLGHPSPKSTLVRIAISEGKNRQVRRMFHAINSGVMQLHRSRVGTIDLNFLKGQRVDNHDGDDNDNDNQDCDHDHNHSRDELNDMEGSWRVLTEKEVLDGLGWKSRYIDAVEEGSSTSTRSGSRNKKKGQGARKRSRNTNTHSNANSNSNSNSRRERQKR